MEDLKEELEKLSQDPILSKEFRKKKLIIYLVRTLIAIVIIYFLWDYDWIKWVLYLYIPLNLISLVSIFGWNFLLNKKLKKSQEQLNEVMNSFDEEE
jgi:putative flippase GtrA